MEKLHFMQTNEQPAASTALTIKLIKPKR